MIPQSFIEDLKMSSDIETVISSYVQLKKRGRISVGLCPFHSEKTGSFTVYPDSQSFYCFGCGAGGDVVGFIRRIENLEYVEAIKFLAEKNGMSVPEDVKDDKTAALKTRILEMNREAAHFFYDSLLSEKGKEALQYLYDRKLTAQTIKHFGIGYATDSWNSLTDYLKSKGYRFEDMEAASLARKGKNGSYYDIFRHRVVFPIIDLRGNVIGFSGRKLRETDNPKYYNTNDTLVFKKTKNLFALNFAKKNANLPYLIMCEGAMDVIAMHQAGFTEAVASLGTSLTTDQCRLASAYVDTAILAYDADEAGQKATKRAIGLLDEAGITSKVLVIPDAKDPDEYIKKYGAVRFRKLIEDSTGSVEYALGKIKSKYDLESPEGKISAIKETVSLLSEMKNAIEREVWAGKLSGEFQVPKDGLLSEAAKLMKRKARADEKKAILSDRTVSVGLTPEKLKNPVAARAEERLLGSLIRHPEKSKDIILKISPSDFTCELYRRFYNRILEAFSEGDDINISIFNESFTLEEQGVMSKIISTAREHHFESDDADDAAETMLKIKNKKTDGEIAQMDGSDLTDYIEKIRKEKMMK